MKAMVRVWLCHLATTTPSRVKKRMASTKKIGKNVEEIAGSLKTARSTERNRKKTKTAQRKSMIIKARKIS